MYTFTNQFMASPSNSIFLKDNMMGPNAMRLTEELAQHLNITKDMRILDLGCGRGLSSLLLEQKYGATVFAADLWIEPTDNYKRFKEFKVEDRIIPLLADANKGLPFAHQYFDLLVSVDAYHYFGDSPQMLPSLIHFVKKGGYIAVVLPGIKYEFGENVPAEMQPFWSAEVARTIHSLPWWKALWEQEKGIEIVDAREMLCCQQSWDEWHTATWEGIEEDIKMKKAENGNYYNLIQLIAKVL
ncbi:MAG: SAM-dependent methyltransferase [Oscillospiraceae bacterium]